MEEPWLSVFFFKSVVQAVLLFGAETWVVTPRMVRFLGGVPGSGVTAAYGVATVTEN